MRNRAEAVKNYLGSVADRTVGFSGWSGKLPYQEAVDSIGGSFVPAFSRTFGRGFTEISQGKDSNPLLAVAAVPAIIFDTGAIVSLLATMDPSFTVLREVQNHLAPLIHNPLEVVAAKLVINAATHVSLDAIGAGINLAGTAVGRIKNLRPHSSTLAI